MKGFDQMTDEELIGYAILQGNEDYIEVDSENNLLNREDLISTIVQSELNEMMWESEDQFILDEHE